MARLSLKEISCAALVKYITKSIDKRPLFVNQLLPVKRRLNGVILEHAGIRGKGLNPVLVSKQNKAGCRNKRLIFRQEVGLVYNIVKKIFIPNHFSFDKKNKLV